MIDLHMHTIFSDGELIPAEMIRRVAVAGYSAMALTDHGDLSNFDFIIPRIVEAAEIYGEAWGITVVPGIELTHIPPDQIAAAANRVRELGARLVVCHGETLAEPVAEGTNAAALSADIDILSHPGLVSDAEAKLAADRGICLEITTRKGHSLTNGHVAQIARKHGAKLVVNNDAHGPGDLVSAEMSRKIALGAGLSVGEYDQCRQNSIALVEKAMK